MRSVSIFLGRSRVVKRGESNIHTIQVRRYSEAVKVPFDLIKQLRLKTKAGLTDCKDALAASNLDMAKAEDWLKERAKVIAAKKADRTAAEGVIAAVADKKSKRAVLLELLCETDFASRSPSYMKAAIELAAAAYQHPITSSQGLVGNEAFGTWLESAPVKEKMEGLAFTLREKVEIRRVASVAADIVGFYAHNKAEMPADVTVPADVSAAVCPKAGIITMSAKGNASDAAQSEIADFGAKLARQVVAMNPRFLNDAQKAAAGPKPENEDQWETLYEQEYMSGGGGKQTSSVIKAHQKQFKHAHQVEIDITSFLRWEVGEGVERKQENYGEEVAKLVKGH